MYYVKLREQLPCKLDDPSDLLVEPHSRGIQRDRIRRLSQRGYGAVGVRMVARLERFRLPGDARCVLETVLLQKAAPGAFLR